MYVFFVQLDVDDTEEQVLIESLAPRGAPGLPEHYICVFVLLYSLNMCPDTAMLRIQWVHSSLLPCMPQRLRTH